MSVTYTQADYEKVRKCILQPIESLYGPVEKGAIDFWVEDLKGFSEQQLNKAFVDVRRSSNFKPKINQILEAIKGDTQTTGTAEAFLRKLQTNANEARKASREYVKSFEKTKLARNLRDRNEAHFRIVRSYVATVAHSQAMLIRGFKNVAVPNCIKYGERHVVDEEYASRRRFAEKDMYQAKQAGSIGVTVPDWILS